MTLILAALKAMGGAALSYWRPLAGVALAALVAVSLFAWGHNTATKAAKAAEQTRALAEARRRVALQSEIDRLNQAAEANNAARAEVVRVITREVPKYVKAPPQACVDSGLHAGGFRVLFDAAAERRAPEPASLVAATPVSAVDAAAHIVDTIAGCHRAADQVDGWRGWWLTVNSAK